MRRISEHVFAEIYFWDCNPGFFTTSDGVFMIDTPQQPIDAVRGGWTRCSAPLPYSSIAQRERRTEQRADVVNHIAVGDHACARAAASVVRQQLHARAPEVAAVNSGALAADRPGRV
jgi:hypothetical protein